MQEGTYERTILEGERTYEQRTWRGEPTYKRRNKLKGVHTYERRNKLKEWGGLTYVHTKKQTFLRGDVHMNKLQKVETNTQSD